MSDEVKQRKLEHVTIALEQDVSVPQRANWHDVQLVHQALPEVDLDDVDTSVSFLLQYPLTDRRKEENPTKYPLVVSLPVSPDAGHSNRTIPNRSSGLAPGHTLRYPIVVSSLTGGHPDVTTINQNLARAAEQYGLALGVGSQRAAIVNPDLAASYAITRENAPHAFLIANIGAPQLIPQARHAPFTLEQIQRAIDMIGANALAVHLNSLQEATQLEGDHRAVGQANALKMLTQQLSLPVIAKETGAGICREQALLLRSCGVAAIDVGGAGGSSMPALEAARSQFRGDEQMKNIGQLYRDWGIATPVAVVEASTAKLPLIATGGVRNGLDVARALALGASLVGLGFPFLKAASESYEKVCELLESLIAQLKVAMQLTGSATIEQLRQTDVVITGFSREWLTLRGFDEDLKGMAQRRWRKHMEP